MAFLGANAEPLLFEEQAPPQRNQEVVWSGEGVWVINSSTLRLVRIDF